jgi:hypothetical protein
MPNFRLTLIAIVPLLCAAAAHADTYAPARPNVILIMTDDKG